MLELLKVWYKNFCSTGNDFTEIDLILPWVMIFGESGAGKSTIIRVLNMILFNKSNCGSTKSSLLNRINKKEFVGGIELRTNGKHYKIIRGMKPDIFEIYEDGELIKQQDSKEYQKYLEENILKMNHKMFNQLVVMSKTNYKTLFELSAEERRVFLENILDISFLSDMKDKLKTKIQENDNETKDISYKISLNKKDIESKSLVLETLQNNKEEQIKQINDDISKNEIELEVIKNEIITNEKKILEIDNIKKQNGNELLKDLKNRQSYFKNEIFSSKRSKQELENKKIFYDRNNICPTCKNELLNKDTCVNDLNIEIQKNIDNITSFENEIIQIEKRIEKGEKYIQSFTEKEEFNRNVSLEIRNLKNKESYIIQQLDKMKQNVSVLSRNDHDKISDIVNSLQRLQDEEASETKKYNEKFEKSKYLKACGEILKDNALRAYILKDFIPQINGLINYYLDKLNLFCKVEFDNNMKISLRKNFRDEYEYENLSEGEKQRLNLAILFTWRHLAKMRSSCNINLLFIDEMLDISLGKEDLLRVIELLQEEFMETNIFVITHKTEILDDYFDNKINFYMEGNFSKCKKMIENINYG